MALTTTTPTDINVVIDRIVLDPLLRDQVLRDGVDALGHLGIERGEAVAIAEAVRADGGTEPFTHLRRQARFEPLFAAASASATKIG